MKVLVTGGSGFVGKNLNKYLNEKNVEISNISLRDDNWLNKVGNDYTALIHLAGKAHDTANSSNPEEYFKINRNLSIKLFDHFLKSEIRDFFYFSSVKAVADTVEDILTEEKAGQPLTPYGKSKLEAEEYMLSKFLPAGKRLFIIRPCMIHGPGNKGNLNLLFNIVKRNVPWPLGEFENKRSFLSIDNLNYLLFNMLINNKLASGVYNFSDDKPLSTNELVSLMSSILHKKGKIWKLNKRLIVLLAKLGDRLSLPLNSERLKKLTESYVVSNQKIKNGLQISELPFSVEEGIKTTINSFTKISK